MKYALKSIPGIADVGVPHGDEDGPVALAPGYRLGLKERYVVRRSYVHGL